MAEIEHMGGMVQCIANRENILYAVDCFRHNLPKALDILAETVLSPTFPEEELEESRVIVGLQRDDLPSEILSRDLVQQAAYLKQPIGNPHYCPLNKINDITAAKLHAFRAKYFVGENCYIAASGVDHKEFVSLVQSRFQSLPRGNTDDLVMRPSVYTGGLITEQRELKEPFVKLALAFEVGGWSSDTLVPSCVMQMLLGGGKSFSAGGPGKGMYTRLYTQVLNRFYWAESVESFVTIFEQSGLLGIDGACPPENVPNMIATIVEQFCILAHFEVSEEELTRAKNMLKSTMMMQLESRLVVCEDIGRQFSTYGKRELPEVVCEKIDAVTAKDLMEVAGLMLEKPPAVACIGHDVSQISPYEVIANFTKQVNQEVWKKAKAGKK
ncbi:insulinase family protein [archaeon]|nr:MAG: insulinase family protein [archaeon]